jgi:aryl-phospho-beta-D-glucosidase BglC (GH1 family)
VSSSSVPSTGGTFRVDGTGNITKNGEVFPVRCGNWFGLEGQHEPKDAENNADGAPMELYAGNMWWANTGRTIQQTMTEIKAQGINLIRLPIAPQTLDATNPQGIGDIRAGGVLKNHPSVRQTNARQAMEDFIKLADQNNIEVLIDIHSCSNYVGWRAGRLDARPPYVDATRENYEFTREGYSCAPVGTPGVTTHAYNESIWLDNLKDIAGLSAKLGVDNIIGIDIFNEPWDYTWADWKRLSESAYTAINSVNPDMLIFVEGISASADNQDGSPDTITEVPHGSEDYNPNWGENLFEAGTNPLNIPKSRLVYSPHTYGPSVFVQKHFMDPAQPECEGLEGDAAGEADCNIVINETKLRAGWDEHFGYLRAEGYAMVVGEFGGNMDWPQKGTISDRNKWSHITTNVDQQWQQAFVKYAKEKKIQGCYWSINPESGDTHGWYGHSYDAVSNESGWGTWLPFDARKTSLLKDFWGN